jgi:hypothetical protein
MPSLAVAPVESATAAAQKLDPPGPAFNGVSVGTTAATGPAIQLRFDYGSAELTGNAASLIDRLAAIAARGPIEVTIVARDTETPDPARRDTLTNQRIVVLTAALCARGIAPRAIATLWRPAPTDGVVHRDGAGQQDIARLRIGG